MHTGKSSTRWLSYIGVIRYLPDVFLALSLGAIVINDLVGQFFHHKFFDSLVAVEALAAPLIVATIALIWRLTYELKEQIAPLNRLASKIIEVLPGEGAIPCAEFLRKAREVDVLTLSGSVMVPLEDQEVVSILDSATRGARVRCLLGNPFSLSIESRYANDEPDYKRGGAQAIEQRLCWLFNLRETFSVNARRTLQIRVYDSYPMLSVFRADSEVFASYYGYKLRGNDTPTLKGDAGSYFGHCVMKHFERLFSTSCLLDSWVVSSYAHLRAPHLLKFSYNYSGILLKRHDGKFLLQRRDKKPGIENPGLLSVFGGRRQDGESPLQTAVRELSEETHLKVKPSQLKEIATYPSLMRVEHDERCILSTYFVHSEVDESKIKLIEGSGVEILSREEISARTDVTADLRKLMEIYLEKI